MTGKGDYGKRRETETALDPDPLAGGRCGRGRRGDCVLAERDASVSRGNELPPKDSGRGQPDGSLARYVAQLQQAPDDQELREKIVKLAARANPVPEIPEQAKAHYAKARGLFETAETINDVGKAIDAYQAALLVAPWWPEANRSLGLALETAQRHDEAIAALRLYLAAEPAGRDAAATEEEIHKIEAKRNKSYSMPLRIPTRCQFKVPALVGDYWLYIDGRLVKRPAASRCSPRVHHVGIGSRSGI